MVGAETRSEGWDVRCDSGRGTAEGGFRVETHRREARRRDPRARPETGASTLQALGVIDGHDVITSV
jgi:hypothetical protein